MNIPEIISNSCSASANTSRSLITKSLREVQEYLGVDQNIDWTGRLYQYTNRLAHLYFLRKINNINAYLIFVYFFGDRDVNGPASYLEWKAALAVAKGILGIGERNRLNKYIVDIFIDIAELSASPEYF